MEDKYNELPRLISPPRRQRVRLSDVLGSGVVKQIIEEEIADQAAVASPPPLHIRRRFYTPPSTDEYF